MSRLQFDRFYLLCDTTHEKWSELKAQLESAWASDVGTEHSENHAWEGGSYAGQAYVLGILDRGRNPVDLDNPSIILIHDQNEQKTEGIALTGSSDWQRPKDVD